MIETLSLPGFLGLGWRTVIISVALLLFSVYLAQSIAAYRRLRAFKGPIWASVSQTWLAHKTMSGGLYLTMRDISQKYGVSILSAGMQMSEVDV
jgi:hypothetical protein